MKRTTLFILLGLIFNPAIKSQSFVFEKTYDWTEGYFGDLISTDDNGYAFIGVYKSLGVFVMKLNSNGDSLWSRRISPGNFVYYSNIIQAKNSDLIIAHNNLLLRLSSTGDSLSGKIYPSEYETHYKGVIELDNGNIVVGFSEQSGDEKFPPYGALECYNSNWDLEWINHFGSSFFSVSSTQTSENQIVVAGLQFSPRSGIWIGKFSSEGDSIFNTTFDTGTATRVIESVAGDIYAITDDINVVKLNSEGTVLWKGTKYQDDDANYYTICEIGPNQFAIGGESQGRLSIHMFDQNGDSLGVYTYNKYESQVAEKIVKDDESIVVGGTVNSGYLKGSILIFKIKLDSLDTGNSRFEPSQNDFQTVYPNPASDYIRFFVKDEYQPVKIFVYDIMGKLKLTEDFDNIANPILNVKALEPGIYFARIIRGRCITTIKFIISK